MCFSSVMREARRRQEESKKYANPRKSIAYYVNIVYDKRNQEWVVTRYDDHGIQMEREKFHYKSNAKWVAEKWMEEKGVTRIYVHKVNGKMDDVIFNGAK